MSSIAQIEANQLLEIVVPWQQEELNVAQRHQEIAQAETVWASHQKDQSHQASMSTQRCRQHHDQDIRQQAHHRPQYILQDHKPNTNWNQNTHTDQRWQQQQLKARMVIVSFAIYKWINETLLNIRY